MLRGRADGRECRALWLSSFRIAAAVIGVIASGNIAIASPGMIAPPAIDSIAIGIGIESQPIISGIIEIKGGEIR